MGLSIKRIADYQNWSVIKRVCSTPDFNYLSWIKQINFVSIWLPHQAHFHMNHPYILTWVQLKLRLKTINLKRDWFSLLISSQFEKLLYKPIEKETHRCSIEILERCVLVLYAGQRPVAYTTFFCLLRLWFCHRHHRRYKAFTSFALYFFLWNFYWHDIRPVKPSVLTLISQRSLLVPSRMKNSRILKTIQ